MQGEKENPARVDSVTNTKAVGELKKEVEKELKQEDPPKEKSEAILKSES